VDAFKEARRAERYDVAGIFRHVKADADMALGSEIVDLIGLDVVDDAGERTGIGEVAVMQEQPRPRLCGSV